MTKKPQNVGETMDTSNDAAQIPTPASAPSSAHQQSERPSSSSSVASFACHGEESGGFSRLWENFKLQLRAHDRSKQPSSSSSANGDNNKNTNKLTECGNKNRQEQSGGSTTPTRKKGKSNSDSGTSSNLFRPKQLLSLPPPLLATIDEMPGEGETSANPAAAVGGMAVNEVNKSSHAMESNKISNKQQSTTTTTTIEQQNSIDKPVKVEEKEEEFVIFCVRIHLREGHGLAVRDASGSSDPYVKCQYAGKTLYRSETVFRELHPNWNEEFAFLADDPTQEIVLKVFDYDRFMKDDFMGAAKVDLSTLTLFQKTDFNLPLTDPRGACPEAYLGYLLLSVTLTPLTGSEREKFFTRAVRGIVSEQNSPPRRKNIANKKSTAILSRVNILLVQANLLEQQPQSPKATKKRQKADAADNDEAKPAPDLHAKFKLGAEKFKSKTICRSWTPKWLEQFELHVFDENFQTLDVSIWDNAAGAIIGKCSVDLTDFEPGRTNDQWHPLEEGIGSVHLLLTISTSASSNWEGVVVGREQQMQQIASRYTAWRSLHSLHDIGCLTVKVYEAEGLASADLNGKSDPFCVVELVNLRAQTQTEYKTLNPKWDRAFTFFVKDVHEFVELTVYDEDPNKRTEFLGKIVIPLLKVRNGEKRWYALKNRKLSGPAKGRILVETSLHFNYFKAALRTFKPRERKFVQPVERFKRAKFLANINRLRAIADQIAGWAQFVQSCLSWESYPKSIAALVLYIAFITFVQLWHLPLCLLAIFLHSFVRKRLNGQLLQNSWANRRRQRIQWLQQKANCSKASSNDSASLELEEHLSLVTDECLLVDEEWDEVLDEGELPLLTKEEKKRASPTDESNNNKSLKGRIQAVQDTLVLIQTKSDFLLGLMDRVRNTFTFSVPFLSHLAIVVLLLATTLLFFVPLRWILLAWGINKFSKKLRDPNYMDNNELLDFLSRIPTDKEIRDFRNLSTRHAPAGASSSTSNNSAVGNRKNGTSNNGGGGGDVGQSPSPVIPHQWEKQQQQQSTSSSLANGFLHRKTQQQ